MERLDMLPPLSPPANLSQGPLPLRPREHFLHRPSLYMYIYKKAVWNSKKKKKKESIIAIYIMIFFLKKGLILEECASAVGYTMRKPTRK